MANIYPAPPSAGGNGHEERSGEQRTAARPDWQPPLPPLRPGLTRSPASGQPFWAELTGGLVSGAIVGGLAALLLAVLLRRKLPSQADR